MWGLPLLPPREPGPASFSQPFLCSFSALLPFLPPFRADVGQAHAPCHTAACSIPRRGGAMLRIVGVLVAADLQDMMLFPYIRQSAIVVVSLV